MDGGTNYFENLFNDPKVNRIKDQMQVIREYPKKIDNKDAWVPKDEVQEVLNKFKRSKILDLDGCSIECYIEFLIFWLKI